MAHNKGEVYSTIASGNLEITNYINFKKVEVRFVATGFKLIVRMDSIRSGNVRDPLHRSVCGVGFIGVGEYKVSISGKHTKAYRTWHNMLVRCYSEAEHKRKPWYVGCTTCPDWHNFQTFAKWYDDNYPKGGGDYHLDKDIKIHGNKEYSPDACMFVSPEDNAIKAKAKSYTFRNPSGDIIEVYNLRQFCRDNDLQQGHMWSVHSGGRNSHKGWTK